VRLAFRQTLDLRRVPRIALGMIGLLLSEQAGHPR
jgi:hypothetical protein